MLAMSNDFSREYVEIKLGYGIGDNYVLLKLVQSALFQGNQQAERTDSRLEFTCSAYMNWAQTYDVKRILIEPCNRTLHANI